MLTKATLMASLMLCATAQAGIGVAWGHHTVAEDGFPSLGSGEQISVFWCQAPASSTTGDDLMACAVQECKKIFKEKNCKEDGFSLKKGYHIIAAGKKGDNQFIYSKALASETKELAWKYVLSNKFKLGTTILDAFDDNTKTSVGVFTGGAKRPPN